MPWAQLNDKNSATEAFSCISTLHLVDRGMRAFLFGIFSAVQPDAIETSEDAVCQWAVGIICKALDSITKVLPEDAGAVIQIISTYEDERVYTRYLIHPGYFSPY